MFAAAVGNKPPFDLFARPRCFAQKRQARFDRRITLKTADADALAHFLPAVIFHQLDQNLFQRHAVQRVARVFRWGGHMVSSRVGCACKSKFFLKLCDFFKGHVRILAVFLHKEIRVLQDKSDYVVVLNALIAVTKIFS